MRISQINFRTALQWALLALAVCVSPHSLADSANGSSPTRSLLIIGDSLSAGYGIQLNEGWVAKLQQRLNDSHPGWKVQNASISGDTTGGGKRRLPKLLAEHQPAVVIIELGGNDGLRGQSTRQMTDNLRSMVAASESAGAETVIIRVALPANYGPRYAKAFQQAYLDAAADDTQVTEFLPLDVKPDPALMQDDGIHPNASAQAMMEANVWPAIEKALRLSEKN